MSFSFRFVRYFLHKPYSYVPSVHHLDKWTQPSPNLSSYTCPEDRAFNSLSLFLDNPSICSAAIPLSADCTELLSNDLHSFISAGRFIQLHLRLLTFCEIVHCVYGLWGSHPTSHAPRDVCNLFVDLCIIVKVSAPYVCSGRTHWLYTYHLRHTGT